MTTPIPLAGRMLAIRQACGYGDERRQAAFAKLLGIRPPSLHNIESGRTHKLGAKTMAALLHLGVSLRYIQDGQGEILQTKREIEHQLKHDTLESMIGELNESETDMVTDVVKSIIRRKGGSSPNDPFKKDPPKSGTQ